MPDLTPAERTLRARIAASTRWAKEPDRAEATAKARAARRRKLELEVDPAGVLPPAELERRVASLQRAHMTRMSLAAARARRRRSMGGDAA